MAIRRATRSFFEAAGITTVLLSFLVGCGEDENALDRSNLYTGLWETQTSSGDLFVWELQHMDDGLLEGVLFVERLGELSDPLPIRNGRVSGGVASFDIDIQAFAEDDPIRSVPNFASLVCEIPLFVDSLFSDSLAGDGKYDTDVPTQALPTVGDFMRHPFIDIDADYVSQAVRGKRLTDRLTIDPEMPGCPLDSIATGAVVQIEGVRFTASGGIPPYGWGAGGLPRGIRMGADGTLFGSPTDSPGLYEFIVVVGDAAQIDSFHVRANLENPQLLNLTVTVCNDDTCYVSTDFAERQLVSF